MSVAGRKTSGDENDHWAACRASERAKAVSQRQMCFCSGVRRTRTGQTKALAVIKDTITSCNMAGLHKQSHRVQRGIIVISTSGRCVGVILHQISL